jgi:hypothetical protein
VPLLVVSLYMRSSSGGSGSGNGSSRLSTPTYNGINTRHTEQDSGKDARAVGDHARLDPG